MDGWATLPRSLSALCSALFFSSFPPNDSPGAGGPNALISLSGHMRAHEAQSVWLAG